MYLLKGVYNEETAPMLCGADAVLIVEAGVPKRLELSFLPQFGLSRERWVIFVEGGFFLVERGHYPGLFLVGCVRKYEASDFSSFRAGRANR